MGNKTKKPSYKKREETNPLIYKTKREKRVLEPWQQKLKDYLSKLSQEED